MAWLKTLAETYDVCSGLAGIEKNGQPVLLPVSHSELNAQIEVTIDRDGCFLRAEKLEKGIDAVTMIPVTEASASRSSGIAPHPLCDKLCYLAGDYSTYTGEQKEPYHDAYMEQLRDWAQSCHTHPMVQAVYAYLGRNSLIHDLTASHILQTDDDGRLTDHKNTGTRPDGCKCAVYRPRSRPPAGSMEKSGAPEKIYFIRSA